MKRTFYITTPIYYASGRIHIGHAYCSIMADIIARYKKDCGYDVYFLTGADEHGQKIAEKAKAENLSPQEYVDKISDSFKANWKDLKIKYDQFIRTSSKKHEECVQKVFERLLAQGDIYKSTYSGWYCTPCESFWTETQVGEEHLCPDCHRPVHKDELKDFAEIGLCGTAAVISPVGQIDTPEGTINVPAGMDDMGPITKKLYDTLLGIQHGEIEAPEGWVVKIC